MEERIFRLQKRRRPRNSFTSRPWLPTYSGYPTCFSQNLHQPRPNVHRASFDSSTQDEVKDFLGREMRGGGLAAVKNREEGLWWLLKISIHFSMKFLL